MKEQNFISFFYKKLSSNTLSKTDISKAEKLFPNSHIINYYIGYFYDEKGNKEEAIKYFQKSLEICPNFTNPLFHMGKYYEPQLFLEEYEDKLVSLLNKKTFNPFSGKMEFRLSDQLYVCDFLSNSSNRYTDEFEKIFLRFEAKPPEDDNPKIIRCFKHLCIALSTDYFEYGNLPEKSMRFLITGLKYFHPEVTDIPLLKRINIIKNYVLLEPTLPRTAEEIFNEIVIFGEPSAFYPNIQIPSFIKEITTTPRDRRINIGYLSPDFNKSAVGLFSIPLLKYYNKQKFNVFTYYSCETEDIFTPYFKNYDTNWFDISRMSDDEAYELIHSHRLDILVDLSVFCVNSRIDLIVKKPAKIIINYIGYPNVAHLSAYDYRLVDSITDPPNEVKKSEYEEKLIRMPNCFLCYKLFENVTLPEINSKLSSDDPITILITSRFGKFSMLITRAWEKILSTIPSVRLIIKSEINQDTSKVIDDNEILSKRVVYIPFVNTLEEFFEYHNLCDFSLDVFPYSATTITCSSLLMGRPIFTLYSEKNPHRSNVTASILKNCGEEYDEYISSSLEDYSRKLSNSAKTRAT